MTNENDGFAPEPEPAQPAAEPLQPAAEPEPMQPAAEPERVNAYDSIIKQAQLHRWTQSGISESIAVIS